MRFAIVSDDAEHVAQPALRGGDGARLRPAGDAALRAITLSPAEIFGVADRMGSIAPARTRTCSWPPATSWTTRTQVTHVFIDGVAQSLETRHTRLYEQFKDRP